MAFVNAPSIVDYIASGGQTEFEFGFKWYQETDITVYQIPSGDISGDDKILDPSAYTITAVGANIGGSITLNVGATQDDKITIVRKLPVIRSVEYAFRGDLRANTINDDQDYQTYILLDFLSQQDLYFSVPPGSGFVPEFPAPVPDGYIKYNADGTALEADAGIPQSVVDAEEHAWDSQAEALTSASYAVKFVDGAGGSNEYVDVYTSNNDGTFTATPQTNVFSSKWHEEKAKTIVDGIGNLDSLLDVTTTTPAAGESLIVNPSPTGADDIWINGKVLGLPNEQGQAHKSVTNTGVEGDSFWSPVTTNPNVLTADFTIATGASASVVSGFEIADGVTLTIPVGSVLSVV